MYNTKKPKSDFRKEFTNPSKRKKKKNTTTYCMILAYFYFVF